MSILDKLKGAVFEEPLPADPTVQKPPRAVSGDNYSMSSNSPEPVKTEYTSVGLEMRRRLCDRRSTAVGWDKLEALKAACSSLAEFVPDDKQRMRAAVKTQRLSITELIEYCNNVLTVLASEDVRFRKALEDERAKLTPQKQKDIADTEGQLSEAKQRVKMLENQLQMMNTDLRNIQERWTATETTFVSALRGVEDETHGELEQLKSLK